MTASDARPPRGERGAHWPRAWGVLLAGCLVLISAMDAALLGLGEAYFSSGYNSAYLGGAAQVAAFFLCSAVLDLALVLAAWGVSIPIL